MTRADDQERAERLRQLGEFRAEGTLSPQEYLAAVRTVVRPPPRGRLIMITVATIAVAGSGLLAWSLTRMSGPHDSSRTSGSTDRAEVTPAVEATPSVASSPTPASFQHLSDTEFASVIGAYTNYWDVAPLDYTVGLIAKGFVCEGMRTGYFGPEETARGMTVLNTVNEGLGFPSLPEAEIMTNLAVRNYCPEFVSTLPAQWDAFPIAVSGVSPSPTSTAAAGPASPEEASERLLEAWRANDADTALQLTNPETWSNLSYVTAPPEDVTLVECQEIPDGSGWWCALSPPPLAFTVHEEDGVYFVDGLAVD